MDQKDPRLQTTTSEFQKTELPTSAPMLTLLFSGQVLHQDQRMLSPGELLAGRGVEESAGLSLVDDPQASRLQARLVISRPAGNRPPQVELIDSDSRFGSWVNGRRISRQILADNDVIRLGGSLLHLRYVPQHQRDADVPGLLGQSPQMAAVRAAVRAAVQSTAPLLLEGETGTGKEVVAKAMHQLLSRTRVRGQFVPVNCSAIPASLAESELFGHVRGAFSEAKESRPGLFRTADGGTLFLDEIGEMPPELQPKLLRALEERRIMPVGSNRLVDCDVRVIAATNRSLLQEVAAGRFRADLYSRLEALRINLPPLRQRREEILPLLQHLWQAPLPRLSADLAEEIMLQDWPLNVRGLRNIVEHLSVRHRDQPGAPLDVPMLEGRLTLRRQPSAEVSAATPLSQRLAALPTPSPRTPHGVPPVTREHLAQLMTKHDDVIANVGREVGRSRRQVRRWLIYYGMLPEGSEH